MEAPGKDEKARCSAWLENRASLVLPLDGAACGLQVGSAHFAGLRASFRPGLHLEGDKWPLKLAERE